MGSNVASLNKLLGVCLLTLKWLNSMAWAAVCNWRRCHTLWPSTLLKLEAFWVITSLERRNAVPNQSCFIYTENLRRDQEGSLFRNVGTIHLNREMGFWMRNWWKRLPTMHLDPVQICSKAQFTLCRLFIDDAGAMYRSIWWQLQDRVVAINWSCYRTYEMTYSVSLSALCKGAPRLSGFKSFALTHPRWKLV